MKKREFIKTGTVLTVGAFTLPIGSCKNSNASAENSESGEIQNPEIFSLPELPYAVADLEPHIDQRTMGIHHGKHHAGYVKKLNAALNGHQWSSESLETIVQSVGEEDTAIRNNGGGHYNHSLFWNIMKPGGSEMPSGKLADAVNAEFGSFEKLTELFSSAASSVFGSGWAWLSVNSDNKLFVSSTPNQDNPMMKNLVDQAGTPILGIDVWEHAYYLRYQNRRGDYISNFLKLVNWEEVSRNFDNLS